MEKLIKENEIYNGKVLKYNVDEVEIENGIKATREVVHHPGGVGVLAIKDNYVYLVKQYRYVFKKEIVEIVAGKLNKNEDHQLAALREFNEELGYKAKTIKYLGEFYPSVGYTDEVIYLYFTNNFEKETQHLDEDEFINVIKIKFDVFKEMILTNEIKDGKTIAAYNLYCMKEAK